MNKRESTFIKKVTKDFPTIYYACYMNRPWELLTDEQKDYLKENLEGKFIDTGIAYKVPSVYPMNHKRRIKKLYKALLEKNKGIKTKQQKEVLIFVIVKQYIAEVIQPYMNRLIENQHKRELEQVKQNEEAATIIDNLIKTAPEPTFEYDPLIIKEIENYGEPESTTHEQSEQSK